MNRTILLSFLLTLISTNTMAQGAGVVKGFDGGMMLHTGFVKGEFPQLAHTVSGMPFGIGGVIRVHLGEHWRVGSEGYVSTLQQANNGSYVKYGWGGLLGDFYWQLGRFMPYVVSDAFHLTLKADWLNCMNKEYRMPSGPRLYMGFIFYH